MRLGYRYLAHIVWHKVRKDGARTGVASASFRNVPTVRSLRGKGLPTLRRPSQ